MCKEGQTEIMLDLVEPEPHEESVHLIKCVCSFANSRAERCPCDCESPTTVRRMVHNARTVS